MTFRVVVAIPDVALAAEVLALLREEGAGIDLAGTASTPDEVVAMLGDESEVDAVLLHEDFGPLAVTDLARELSAEFPQVGLVLIVREETPELLRSALQAGARGVLALPLTLERVASGVRQAAEWSRTVRERLDGQGESQRAARMAGRVIAVAGAKGGTGATTTAVHLALMAASAGPEQPVCLVELDLQAGDVRAMLDLPFRRSVADLVGVADDVSSRSLEDSLYVHESGLRVLLAPEHGEDAEDVRAPATRQILGALKFQCDLLVVDVGATVTESNAVAVELADQVLVMTTPDVLALRAANRLVGLWRRLNVRQERVSFVINRFNRAAEVQPDLARKVSLAPVAQTVIPAGFRDLEPAINSGSPGRLAQGPVREALAALAREIGVAAPEPRRPRLRVGAQGGQAAVETVGLVTVIGLVVLFMWQATLVGYTFVLAGHSARTAARAMAVGEDGRKLAEQDLPGAWREGLRYEQHEEGEQGQAEAQVSLSVPALLPGQGTPLRITATESTVIESEDLPEAVQ